ncbi:MAG TPA: zf-HC2 domain-containing protein [Thermoanaerobaculia bacterium]|nr:zf-HC2 domain-containing protein [Thermoanaerobaculia bacterium]
MSSSRLPSDPATGGCPDAQILAAVLDGRCTEAEAAAVESHLATCEGCLETYLEAWRFRKEDAEAEHVAERWRPPFGGTAWRTWAIAAGLLLLTVVAGSWWLHTTTGPGSGEVIAALGEGAELRAALGPGWTDAVWSASRGRSVLIDDSPAAARLGARVVDLTVALRAGDRDAAQAVVEEMLLIVERFEGAETLWLVYRELSDGIGSATPLDELLEEAAFAEDFAADASEPRSFRIGFWLEAGRIAALAGDDSVYRQRGWRRTVDRLREIEVPPPRNARVDAAVAVIARARERDPAETRQAIERLLAAFANGEIGLVAPSDTAPAED